jgi:hypothetical protein
MEYTGVVHVHSKFSDGHEKIPDIIEDARACGLDFVMFSDHMTLEPLELGLQKWFGNVLSIIGYEINDPENINHYITYGLNEVLPRELHAEEYVRAVAEKGGVGFIAHPDEKRSAMPSYPPYPWKAWDAKGFTGIEIWNHASEWLEKLTNLNKYFYIFYPLKSLNGPTRNTLERWDELNREKVVPGIGGTDAHAFPYKMGPLTLSIFRYKVLFKGIRTHILTEEILPDDSVKAVKIVLDSLASARCFVSNYRWGNAKGFRFEANRGEKTWNMGDVIEGAPVEFRASVPEKGTIVLYRNGGIVKKEKGKVLVHETDEPGAWRVVVLKGKKSWIFSNHIHLKG